MIESVASHKGQQFRSPIGTGGIRHLSQAVSSAPVIAPKCESPAAASGSHQTRTFCCSSAQSCNVITTPTSSATSVGL